MIDVIRSVWIWSASALIILLWVPVVLVTRLFDRDPMRRATARRFRALGPILAKVNPWRLHISGEENLHRDRVYVVVSNHQSLADIPLISHLGFDAKWLAKAELFRFPVVGPLMKLVGDIPVDRSDRRKAAQALLQCARTLRDGCSVMFFPEGTRSKDGTVLSFNDGPFQLAIREQVPVLPLAVEGSGAALPRSTWKFGQAQDIYLRVLPEVPTTGMDVKQTSNLRDQVREQIVQAVMSQRQRVNASLPLP